MCHTKIEKTGRRAGEVSKNSSMSIEDLKKSREKSQTKLNIYYIDKKG
jgi:hypothetical protein